MPLEGVNRGWRMTWAPQVCLPLLMIVLLYPPLEIYEMLLKLMKISALCQQSPATWSYYHRLSCCRDSDLTFVWPRDEVEEEVAKTTGHLLWAVVW